MIVIADTLSQIGLKLSYNQKFKNLLTKKTWNMLQIVLDIQIERLYLIYLNLRKTLYPRMTSPSSQRGLMIPMDKKLQNKNTGSTLLTHSLLKLK